MTSAHAICIATLAVSAFQGQEPEVRFPVPQELKDLTTHNLVLPTDELRGSVRIGTDKREIRLTWSWHAPSDPGTHYSSLNQTFTTAFQPTSADSLAGGSLLVAGLNGTTGRTVIELWKFTPPTTVPVTDILTGEASYEMSPMPLESRRTLFSEKVTGMAGVRCMFSMSSNNSKALVQFWDSKDLYEMSWGGAGPVLWTILYSESVCPALGKSEYDAFWRGNHTTRGFVYVMADEDNYCVQPTLFLFDADRDGSIDSWKTVDVREHEDPDLRLTTNFLSLFGAIR